MNKPQIESLNCAFIGELLKKHAKQFEEFSRILIAENAHINLTRIVEPDQIRVRHFADSLAGLGVLDRIADKYPFGAIEIVDIGSGAGFPGLVLALVRPNWHVVSIEATGKKTGFQKQIVDALGLKNVEIINGRAEELAHDRAYRERFDVCNFRAVAGLAKILELGIGFIRPTGILLPWKGPKALEEIENAQNAYKKLHITLKTLWEYELTSDTDQNGPFYLLEHEKAAATPNPYPRAWGRIKNNPL